MSGDFTASNGVIVSEQPEGGFYISDTCRANALRAQALREFLRAEEDARLGRWRWPEHEYFVAYGNPDECLIVNEYGGLSHRFRRGVTLIGARSAGELFFSAAVAYFDAHPELKPWHDAQPGELWMLTIDGEEQEAFAIKQPHHLTVMFQTKHRSIFGVEGTAITAGRCVYPEVRS